MMMITNMMKISLFVLAGMISGSSAINCQQFDDDRSGCFQHEDQCKWRPSLAGHHEGRCITRTCLPPCYEKKATVFPYPLLCICPAASSFVSLEASVGEDEGHYLGVEDYIVDKNIDSSWKSGSGDAASNEYDYYDYEDEDMDEDEDEDVDASLDLASEDGASSRIIKKSYLRAN